MYSSSEPLRVPEREHVQPDHRLRLGLISFIGLKRGISAIVFSGARQAAALAVVCTAEAPKQTSRPPARSSEKLLRKLRAADGVHHQVERLLLAR